MNDHNYDGSEILITGENFGCGSSREHAVWALADHGFRVIIAPSFADIFFSNCVKNGVLLITLDLDQIKKILEFDGEVEVSLEETKISLLHRQLHKDSEDADPAYVIPFDIEPHRRTVLLEGLDEISQTLKYGDKIEEFERKRLCDPGAAPPMSTDKRSQ